MQFDVLTRGGGGVLACVVALSLVVGTSACSDARRYLARAPQARPPGWFRGTPPSSPGRSEASRAFHPKIRWRRSTAVGLPWAGRLVNGVRLPVQGDHFFTWDPVRDETPNRAYRRHATDRLIRVILRVLRDYSDAHPRAPRVGIGDLSRPHGGDFGKRFGGLGHSSHQNGLDVDVYYPRRDGRERAPRRASQIDRALAQDLVDRFVQAGAQFVFVGPHMRLTGPPKVVQELVHHDDHMHVRIPAR